MEYNVLKFGAKGDGVTNDSMAIQTAINACHNNGGGRVILPSGHIFRTGTICLKSYVELHLEMGAVLKGSDNIEDYNLFGLHNILAKPLDTPTYENCEYNGKPTLYFIYANDVVNVAITGFGRIVGNAEIFYGTVTKWHIDGSFYPRVPLLYLEHVTHLTITNVTLTDSAFWTTHLVGCRDVLIDGIRILNSLKVANCDGIDPDRCRNVRITNCHIESADDCIVFKCTANTPEYGPCENIVVSGCTLISTSAAIKFGSESEDMFKNIIIENCNISKTNRAISLQLRDKGSIKNCTFSNINIETKLFSKDHWWGKAEPIAITAVKRKTDTNIGSISNIIFQNIFTDCENGIFIYGDESMNISDIYFEKVHLDISKKSNWPNNVHDIRPTIGSGLIEDNLVPLYIKNAKNIHFSACTLTLNDNVKMDVPENIYVDNCENLSLPEF